MLRARPLAVACTAAVALALSAAPSALAGTYTVNPDTTTDVSGWSFNPDTGVNGCSLLSLPGPCAAADVARPTPLRILMSGAVATDAYGAWRWDAPEGVSIVSGSVKVSYKTTADTSVYMKAILRSEVFHTQPKVHTATTDGSATWTVPSGKEVFALFLDNAAAHTYADKWQNSLAISSMSLTLRDDTAPAVSLSGALASGAWQSSAQPVCLTAHATDAGSGVASVELLDEFGQQVDRVVAPVGDALHPGSTDLTRDLCLTPSDYGDGDHSMTVIAHDAAGEVTYQPLTVEIDHSAPAAAQMTPAERTTDRRAPVSFTVDAGPSGLAAFSAWLDGAPMTIDGATAQLTPATNLAYGLHTVSWHAADRAGNVRDASWTFRVADEVPPALSDATPAAGSSDEERRPAIGFTLTDAGIGVDPASVRVLLDGVDVAPLGSFTGDRFAVVPGADLGFGIHQLRVLASDRSGNAMAPAVWSFSVIDVTAPTLGDPRPDDGSSGSDRTPPISIAAADAGVGIDPAGISLTLDGQDIAGSATWSGGRLTYQPAAALAFGQHTVIARATDRAGNSSAPVTWRFTVRDEVAPTVSGRLPAAGSTVAGAVPIGFDVADGGTGIDPASLQVLVDGSDVTSWGSFDGSRFRYAPGDLGAGVHTVSVTVADRAGNIAGPLMWQFAVANPATLRVSVAGAPRSLVFGGHGTAVLSATSDGSPLAGAHVLVSTRVAGAAGFGATRIWVADAAGDVRLPVAPAHTTDYHVELADHTAVQADFTVAVARRVSLAAASGRVRHGFPLRLSGTVAPLAPGARVTVQLLTGRGWVAVAHPVLGGRSGFTATLVPRVRGRYLFRVLAPATATNLGGTSRTVVVVAR